MNILVIGSGGREHAIVWKLSQSPKKPKLFCAPGNAGISGLTQCVDVPTTDLEALLKFAKDQKIDLTIVGPEAPLAAGIVDLFKKNHLKIFGPTREASLLEASKVYTKEFCKRYKIPQASFKVFEDAAAAKDSLKSRKYPVVVKADGLAQGKGVIICHNEQEAVTTIDKILVESCFGEAGKRIVLEDFLKGEEASFIAMVDGNHVLPLSSAKDHKRLLDNDKGPNTGGMGAYSPSPIINPSVYEKVMEKIMLPAVRGMVTEGFPFVGFLYAGLMVCDKEPNLLEFNVRLGDPEAQAILPRLKTDLITIVEAALEGRLNETRLSWETKTAACIVMISQGYPEKYETGLPIQGLKDIPNKADLIVFHAGTKWKEDQIVTAGGRVLGVTALGKSLPQALSYAYEAASKISWRGCYYRRDIGKVAQ